MARRQSSIVSKIVVMTTSMTSAAVCLCALAVAVLLYVDGRGAVFHAAQATAARITSKIEDRLARSTRVTGELERLVRGEVESGAPDRALVTERLRQILIGEPDLQGVWLITEPNGFDGRDHAFRGAFASSAEGEFYPYWYRAEDGRLVQDTTGKRNNVAEDRASAFYRDPVRRNRLSVTQPFAWGMGEGSGAAKTMASVAAPVRVGGRLVGVVGVDLYLNEQSRLILDEVHAADVHFAVISDKGVVALASDPAVLNHRQSSLPLPAADLLRAGQARQGVVSAWAGRRAILFRTPLQVDGAGSDWTLVVAAPAAALDQSAAYAGLALFVGAVLVALAAALGWRLGHRLADPITYVSGALRRMAEGELDAAPPRYVDSREVEDMVRAMTALQEYGRRAREAEGERRAAENLVNERTGQLRLMSASLPFPEFLNLAAEETMTLTGAAGAMVELIDGPDLICRSAVGCLARSLAFRIPIDASFSGAAVVAGQTLYCEDAVLDSRIHRAAAAESGVRAMIVTPLSDGDRTLGVLAVGSGEPNAFGPKDMEAVRRLADLVSTAISREMAREAAEAANRAKSEFLANMSHEIRTPLNGVVAIAELLSTRDMGLQEREMVDVIRSSSHTLERLLSDVLDLARIESGRVELERHPFHLGDTLRSVAGLARLRADEKGVALRTDIDPAVDGFVIGDVVRVRQVLTNLLSNAVKFTDHGHVALSVQPTPNGVRFEVSDTGIGFDEQAKQKLFGRFQQADGSITRRFGGSGLGLAISLDLVRLMGGALECEGAPGKGARFWFEAPLTPCAASEAAHDRQTEAGPAPVRRLRLLMADDHPVNRKVAQLIVDDAGFELVSVENGVEALEALAGGGFDVVLMDMQMPLMDGLTATREIRKREAAEGRPRTPVLMLTANVSADHVQAALEAGCDGHLPKPILPEALLRGIAAALTEAPATTSLRAAAAAG